MAASIAVAVAMCGCQSANLRIDEIHVVKGDTKAPAGFLSTRFGQIHVPEERWDEFTRPPISIQAAALLEHEKVHARRQIEGLSILWGFLYSTSASFRWKEESAGYETQFVYMAERGHITSKSEALHLVLDSFYGDMVSTHEASEWYDSLKLESRRRK